MDTKIWIYSLYVGAYGRDFKTKSGILVFDSCNDRRVHIIDSDKSYLIKKEVGVVYNNTLWLPEYDPEKAINTFINYYNKKIIEYNLKIKMWNNQINYLKRDPKIIANKEEGSVWLYQLNIKKEEFQLYRGFIDMNQPRVHNHQVRFSYDGGSFLVSEFEGENYNNKVWFYKDGNGRKARIIILKDLLTKVSKYTNRKVIVRDHVEFLKALRE